jgi:hypothetical protein
MMDLRSGSGQLTDKAIDEICKQHHRGFLCTDPTNRYPPSLHCVRGVLGVPEASLFERHLCTSCWRVFGRLAKAAWQDHADEACACGAPRFKVMVGGVPRPVRVGFELPVADVLKYLITHPSNWPVLASSRTFDRPETFWGSPAGLLLDESIGGCFREPRMRDGRPELAVLLSLGVLSAATRVPYICAIALAALCPTTHNATGYYIIIHFTGFSESWLHARALCIRHFQFHKIFVQLGMDARLNRLVSSAALPTHSSWRTCRWRMPSRTRAGHSLAAWTAQQSLSNTTACLPTS